MVLGITFPTWSFARSSADVEKTSWREFFPGQWGGHFKSRGQISFAEKGSFLAPGGANSLEDGTAEFRLKHQLELKEERLLTIHYESIYSNGDTRRRMESWVDPAFSDASFLSRQTVSDDRRLLDLTAVLEENSSHIWYHRLDRLFLSKTAGWGNLRLGRQAVTWGNGLIFNPMDLFNPFSPADVERDYKIGDDMVSAEIYLGRGLLHLLYVPRRNPESRKLAWNQSSLAGKYHLMLGSLELDCMGGYHYGDTVVGMGLSGYLGNAAWRADGVLTLLSSSGTGKDTYMTLAVNLDYSWVWAGKNFYGLLEFYHNSLLENEYVDDAFRPAVLERLARGELHTLGSAYLSAVLQFEAHPLVNIFLTAINNLSDPSGILQPRLVYDPTQNIRITAGADLYWGESGSEFGGWKIPGSKLSTTLPNDKYIWVTWFF